MEAAARRADLKIREDLDARVMFADHYPSWLPDRVPAALVVRDGVWDWFLKLATARRDAALASQLRQKLLKLGAAVAGGAALVAGATLLAGAGVELAAAAVVLAAAFVAVLGFFLHCLSAP